MSRSDEPATAAEAEQRRGKTKKRKRLLLEPDAEKSVNDGDNSLTKALGSPDYQTRDKALQVLTRWLKLRPTITDSDLNKIWKGLFYTFWHSDKQPVQEALAERLAEILPQLQPEVAFAYFRSFMDTVRREWFGIDRLRLDKFMMLVRKFVQQTFEHLRRLDWEAGEVRRFADHLQEKVLLNGDAAPDLGLVYHLADCWVPELLGSHAADPVPRAALAALLEPLGALLARMGNTAGILRVTRGAFEPMLPDPEDGAATVHGLDSAFLHDLADSLFALGASEGVKAKNRDALYQLSRRLHQAAERAPEHPPAATKQASAAAKIASQPPKPSPAQQPPLAATKGSKPPSRLSRAQGAPAAAADPTSDVAAARTNGDAGDMADPAAAAVSVNGKKRQKRQKAVPATTSEPSGKAADIQATMQRVTSATPGSTPAGRTTRSQRAPAITASAPAAAPAAQGATAEANGFSPAAPKAVGRTKQQPQGVTAAESPVASTPDSGSRAQLAKRKSVKFHMKNNLYFTHGEPPLSPDVRTPPGVSRFPGSALRTKAPTTEPARRPLNGTPTSQRKKLPLKSPQSLPRAKAAAFF